MKKLSLILLQVYTAGGLPSGNLGLVGGYGAVGGLAGVPTTGYAVSAYSPGYTTGYTGYVPAA